MTKIALSPRLYLSYGQFMVYDKNVQLPGCAWTDEHSRQGFARRESVANFRALIDFGHADVQVSLDAYEPRLEYERVIAVPFKVTSGEVIVEGPEETEPGRAFALTPGDYRLVAAQYATGDEEEAVDLFLSPATEPPQRSAILVADKALSPPSPLIEAAGIAGEQ